MKYYSPPAPVRLNSQRTHATACVTACWTQRAAGQKCSALRAVLRNLADLELSGAKEGRTCT
eukprot:5335853-Pyramimonas_sp.AAC.1